MALHWARLGLTDEDREALCTEWAEAGDDWETPTACGAAWLPRCGAGHTLRGVWPPRDVPDHVWRAILLYQHCEDWRTLPLPGGIMQQCSWWLSAALVIRKTLAEIDGALMEEESWRQRQKQGG